MSQVYHWRPCNALIVDATRSTKHCCGNWGHGSSVYEMSWGIFTPARSTGLAIGRSHYANRILIAQSHQQIASSLNIELTQRWSNPAFECNQWLTMITSAQNTKHVLPRCPSRTSGFLHEKLPTHTMSTSNDLVDASRAI